MVIDAPDLDYEALARDAEAEGGPSAPPDEPKTHGPILIGPNGEIIDGETGDVLVGQVQTPATRERGEFELDLTTVAVGLYVVAFVVVGFGIIASPLTVSQKCVILSLCLVVVAERLWYEIKHVPPPTAIEGAMNEPYTFQPGYQFGANPGNGAGPTGAPAPGDE